MEGKQVELICSILQANPGQLTKQTLNESWILSFLFSASTESENKATIKALITSFEQEPNLNLENRICMVDGMLFKEQVLSQSDGSEQLEVNDAYNLVVNTANACGMTDGLTDDAKKYFYHGIKTATRYMPRKVKMR